MDLRSAWLNLFFVGVRVRQVLVAGSFSSLLSSTQITDQ